MTNEYVFTVSCKYLGKGKLSLPEIRSWDININDYPHKVAVIRGKGFRDIRTKVNDMKRKPFLNSTVTVEVKVPKEIWEQL